MQASRSAKNLIYKKKGIYSEMTKKPSSGLTKKQKSSVTKKARAGKDIGKKGGGFKKIVAKVSKKYGKERAVKIAAAQMWKNIKRKS